MKVRLGECHWLQILNTSKMENKIKEAEKISKYHTEEILLILFILSSDFKKYSEAEMTFFAESIEGRIEVLFNTQYVKYLPAFKNINESYLADFDELQRLVTKLYASKWSEKLKCENNDNEAIKVIAKRILKNINVEYCDPISFSENHLNIDWT